MDAVGGDVVIAFHINRHRRCHRQAVGRQLRPIGQADGREGGIVLADAVIDVNGIDAMSFAGNARAVELLVLRPAGR